MHCPLILLSLLMQFVMEFKMRVSVPLKDSYCILQSLHQCWSRGKLKLMAAGATCGVGEADLTVPKRLILCDFSMH